ncbi:DUF4907 domain-containing protein [Flavobacterium panacagri]|uniref:DUF4907 domain-containing protein n=1 Tax=Flavobacterium panacagri TaxID=3034146 RepID=UPI0025A5F93C|nr:DUF4907 domain-containing protein [Flavobacterium panacagri]
MMITNIKKHFWALIQKCFLFSAFFIFLISCTKKEALTAASFKTESGWGYTISYKEKILIKQTVIPVVSDNKSFASENDALKVADLVKQKLKQNLSPAVTKKDLILLKIKL